MAIPWKVQAEPSPAVFSYQAMVSSLLEAGNADVAIVDARTLGDSTDGNLAAGPLKGVTVPLLELKADYYRAMDWDVASGKISRARAEKLGLTELLDGYVAA